MIKETAAFHEVKWIPDEHLLYTRVTGLYNHNHVDAWEQALRTQAKKIPDNSTFKFIIDEAGYQFENIDVHKYKREVIPRFLAHYGLVLSLLTDEDKKLLRQSVSLNNHNIQCIAVAMSHHDTLKMQQIQATSGTENEGYFSDYSQAYQWIMNV